MILGHSFSLLIISSIVSLFMSVCLASWNLILFLALEVNTVRFLVHEIVCAESWSFSCRSNSSGNKMLTRLCVSSSVCERLDPSQQHVECRPPGLLICAKPLLIPPVGEQTYAVCTFRPDQSTAASFLLAFQMIYRQSLMSTLERQLTAGGCWILG